MSKTLVVGVVIAAVGAAAHADVTEAFRVNAENSADSASFVVNFEDGTWEGNTWTYQLDNAVDLDGVGVIRSATIIYDRGSRGVGQTVSLNFNVAAGGSNTVFDVSSGTAMANLVTAMGRASAAVTLTDTLGDGATMTPDGASTYTAYYNGLPGSVFAGLLNSSISAGAFATVTADGDFPGGGGFAPVAGSVNDISARWTFAVSPFDIASGTSVFTVVPAPGTLAMLGLGGLALRRRR